MTTILERVRSPELLEASSAKEFSIFVRLVIAASNNPFQVAALAEQRPTSERIRGIAKSAITGGTLTDWSAISDYRTISQAWSASLRSQSAFDLMLPSMTPAPLRSRGITVVTGISGSLPGERQVKPISSIALGNSLLEPKKSAAVVVVTEEVAKSADPAIAGLFDSELRRAVATASDFQFLADLIAATTPVASAGSSLANIMTDLGVLFGGVTTGAGSRLFYIASSANMKKLALTVSTSGGLMFPGLGPSGGTLMPGVTAIASDSAGQFAIMADASGIAGSADTIGLDMSRMSSLQMSTTPDSPEVASTVLLHLWQTDHRALRAERFFGAVVLRSGAVASLSGVNY